VIVLLYIAKHKLIVGNGITVKAGQYVQSGVNISEDEIPGLLQIDALELVGEELNVTVPPLPDTEPEKDADVEPDSDKDAGDGDKKLEDDKDPDSDNEKGDDKGPDREKDDSAGGSDDVKDSIFTGKSQEEIDAIFKLLDKKHMIALGAEHKIYDLSMEMTREEIIDVLVENNVAPA
jgi:hypothetical protein